MAFRRNDGSIRSRGAFSRKGGGLNSNSSRNNNVNDRNSNQAMTTTVATVTGTGFSSLQGVRPGTSMTYKTSTGLAEFDNLLDGGQLVNTSLMIQEDHLTGDIARAIVRYWCAEGVSQHHHLIAPLITCNNKTTNDTSNPTTAASDPVIIDFDNFDNDVDDDEYDHRRKIQSDREHLEHILSSLPQNRHWVQKSTTNKNNNDSKTGSRGDNTDGRKDSNSGDSGNGPSEPERHQPQQGLNVLAEEPEDGEEDEEVMENSNARGQDGDPKGTGEDIKEAPDGGGTTTTTNEVEKSKPSPSVPISDTTTKTMDTRPPSKAFCHSYDLARRMSDQITIDPKEYILNVDFVTNDRTAKTNSRSHGFELFRQLLTKIKEQMKERRAVVRLLFLQPPLEMLAVTLPLVLAYCRSNSIPIVMMICTPRLSTNLNVQNEVARNCDYVLTAESFISAKEYPPGGDYQHLRGLLKIVKTTSKTAASTPSLLYGVKRDARKLHLSLLHIQPE
mmetsp:Transcript_30124/g.73181  ORF Transcript_30124/g.73181 Transcript_30124/m.73181 type:complete len:501 (+) Transcript_30124:132-1634(+)